MPFNPYGQTEDADYLIERTKEEEAFPELKEPHCPGCGEPGPPHPRCECVKPEEC